MKPCRFCTSPIPDAATVCPSCGRDTGLSNAAAAVLITAGLFALLFTGIWVLAVISG